MGCGRFGRMIQTKKPPLRCYCGNTNEGSNVNCDTNKTCTRFDDDARCYYSIHRLSNGNSDWEQNCGNLKLCAWYKSLRHQDSYCCNTDYCNSMPPNGSMIGAVTQPVPTSDKKVPVIIVVSLFIVALIIFVIYYFKKGRPRCKSRSILQSIPLSDESDAQQNLQERSLAYNIALGAEIGRGSFGRVHVATMRRDQRTVAVKVFLPELMKSFEKEKNVFRHIKASDHRNILACIGSDTWLNPETSQRELWLVTEYCQAGSLHQYLERQAVADVQQCVEMLRDICAGLDYLHHGMKMFDGNKLEIAHRDLKPSNILLREVAQGKVQCVIGDFGHSVWNKNQEIVELPVVRCRGTSNAPLDDITQKQMAGTVRYMAPEVLTRSMNMRDFEKFKASDIYSLGLVFWEIGARTLVNGEGYTLHVLPFHELKKPSILEMARVVCDEQKRPACPPFWEGSDIMKDLYRLMCECWAPNPTARLAALYVLMQLQGMLSRLDQGAS